MKKIKLTVLIVAFLSIALIESAIIIHIIHNNSKNIAVERTVDIKMDNKLKETIENSSYEHGTLLEASYSYFNDMEGTIDTITYKNVTNSFRLYTKYRENNGSSTIVKEYSVDIEDEYGLEKLIKKYNFPVWTTFRSQSEFEDLDGPSIVFSFIYDDSKYGKSSFETYTFTYDEMNLEGMKQILAETKEYFLGLVKDKNFIRESESTDE